MATEATAAKFIDSNSWDFLAEPKIMWGIFLEDDSLFDMYPTLKLAKEDAIKYDINLTVIN